MTIVLIIFFLSRSDDFSCVAPILCPLFFLKCRCFIIFRTTLKLKLLGLGAVEHLTLLHWLGWAWLLGLQWLVVCLTWIWWPKVIRVKWQSLIQPELFPLKPLTDSSLSLLIRHPNDAKAVLTDIQLTWENQHWDVSTKWNACNILWCGICLNVIASTLLANGWEPTLLTSDLNTSENKVDENLFSWYYNSVLQELQITLLRDFLPHGNQIRRWLCGW